MAVGARHKFAMIIFTQKRGRCEPSWGKYTKAVFRRLLRVKIKRINIRHGVLIAKGIYYMRCNGEIYKCSQILLSKSWHSFQDPIHSFQRAS